MIRDGVAVASAVKDAANIPMVAEQIPEPPLPAPPHTAYAAGGVLLAFLAYAFYAISDASVHALNGGIPPFEIGFVGAALGMLLLPLAWRRGTRFRDAIGGDYPTRWLIRAVAAIVGGLGSIIAFTRLPMPEAFALIFLMPFCVTVLSVLFLDESIGPWRWATVIAGFAGVLIVLRPGLRPLDWGHAAAIACALSSAATVVMLRKGGTEEGLIAKFVPGVVGAGVVNGLLMIPTFRWPNPSQAVLLLGYAGLAWLGQYLLLLAARRDTASRIAPPQYSQMIWAVLFSYLLFRQPVDVMTVIGIIVIIGAGLLTWVREQLRRRARPDLPLQ